MKLPRLFARNKPKPRATGNLFTEYGARDIINALDSVPDPDKVLGKLGRTRADLKTLEYDEEIYTAIDTRREAIIALPWRLSDPGTRENRNIKWLRQTIKPHINDLTRAIWSAVPYGYSVVEMIYSKEADGRIGIAKVVPEGIDKYKINAVGELQRLSPSGQYEIVDTQFKFLLSVRNPTGDNPYGEALLSRLWWVWFFRQNNWKFWARFMERFGDPLIVGESPIPGDFVDEVIKIGYDAVIGVPSGSNVHMMESKGAGEHSRFESAINSQIQKTLLGQTLTTEVGNTGSYAAAKVQNEVRIDRRNADARLVAGTVQRLIDALWLLNGLAGDPPAFAFDTEDNTVTPEQASAYASLKSAGITLTEQYLLREHDFIEGDFEIISDSPPQPASMGAGHSLQLAAGQGGPFTPAQSRIESLVDSAVQAAPSPIPAADIHKAIRLSKTPEELEQRLAKLAGNADLDAFRDILERALFTADVIGYAAADKREL